MTQILCCNHPVGPVLMQPYTGEEAAAGRLYICPRCNSTVQLQTAPASPAALPSNSLIDGLARLGTGAEQAGLHYLPGVAGHLSGRLAALEEFLAEYVRRYRAANLEEYLALWDDGAVQEVRSGPAQIARQDNSLPALRRSYEGFFQQAGPNRYRLVVATAEELENGFRVEGFYGVEYEVQGQNHSYEGWLSLTLAWGEPAGSLRIQRLSFQPATFT